jgi:hypothetical protein
MDLKFFLFLFFWDRVSLCDPAWPQTHNPPVSASSVLGLQMCVTMPGIDLSSMVFWKTSAHPLLCVFFFFLVCVCVCAFTLCNFYHTTFFPLTLWLVVRALAGLRVSPIVLCVLKRHPSYMFWGTTLFISLLYETILQRNNETSVIPDQLFF